MKNRFLLILFILSFLQALNQNTFAQKNPLDVKISIKVDHQTVEKTLDCIGKAGNITFSYNSDNLPLDSVVSFDFNQKEIRKILHQLFGSNYTLKTTGQHIIILKNKKLQTKPSKEKINIRGSIYETGTHIRIANTSVYHLSGKEGVLTDLNGNFSITIQPQEDMVSLGINNRNYRDTIVFVQTIESQPIDISLNPKYAPVLPIEPKSLPTFSPEKMEQKILVTKLVNSDMRIHAQNINYYKQRPAQISFLPYMGSNFKLSGSIVNTISLNVFSGYSYGVNGVEVGGFLNINRNMVNGVQLGGFGNITGKNTHGVQIGGFFNNNFGKVKGVQVAGFYNLVLDTVDGIQVAGFTNILKGKIKGVQLSGFTNITTGEVNGVQISGFMNYAKKVQGAQIGVLNIADSVSGVSLGLISLIKNGVHQLSFFTDENKSINFHLSLGSKHLYNIFGITTQPFSNPKSWGAVYGLGSQFFSSHKLNVNVNLTATHFNVGKIWDNELNEQYKLSTDINFRFSKRFILFAAPSFMVDNPSFETSFGALAGLKYDFSIF